MKQILRIPILWLLLTLGAPLVIVFLIALAEPADRIPPYTLGLSLDNLTTVATDPLYRDALLRSLRVAGISTAACLVLGFPMAMAISRAPESWRNNLLLAVMLPFWTGFLMRINAWIGILGGTSLLYSDWALYIGMVYTYLPFMVLPLYARLSRLDPSLIEAAADLGAPPAVAFARITMPLALPGIAAGSALVFIPAIGEYVIPALLGGPQAQLIGKVLWEEFFANRDWPTASAVAVWLLAILIVVPWLAIRTVRAVVMAGADRP